MNIDTTIKNGYTVFYINGRIDSANYLAFENSVNEAIDQGAAKLVFNLSNLNYISSSGLRVFLIALKRINGVKGELKLCELQPNILEILTISGLATLFSISATETEAIS
jgi:anti-anti-sigma factor